MRIGYICDGIRTPIGRYGGKLSSIRSDNLAAMSIKELVARNSNLDCQKIDDVIWGCANQAGEDNRNVARMASLLAELPYSVPATTINRLCGSGMDAVIYGARAIASQQAELIIAGGSESMSRAPYVVSKPSVAFARDTQMFDSTMGWRFVNDTLKKMYGTDSMPETAENVALQFNISREDQDKFALASQTRYIKTKKNSFFSDEIMSVQYTIKKEKYTINEDEHPRVDTSFEKLSALKPLFKNGTVTAGNSSGINDGSCALLLSSEQAIKEYSLKPIARIIDGLSVGVEPQIMGIRPAYAGEKLLNNHKLSFKDIDVIEVNEAFASQTLATLRYWGLDDADDRVNANGGAISLGHPLGMSGARLVLTASRQLRKSGGNLALCTMCIGVGQGIAILLGKM